MRLALLVTLATLCSAQQPRDASSLLAEVSTLARTAGSWIIEGHTEVENPEPGDPDGDFRLAWHEPDRASYEFDSGTISVLCDGTTLWMYFQNVNRYRKIGIDEAGAEDADQPYTSPGPGCRFFLADWISLTRGLRSAEFVGRDLIKFGEQSRSCELVRAEYPTNDKSGRRTKLLCIDPLNNLILSERTEVDYSASETSPRIHFVQTTTFSRIERNPELELDLFTFSPPEGATVFPEPKVLSDAAGVIAPVLVEREEPAYPKKVVKAGIEGTVVLSIEVGPDGKAHNARVVHSVDPELDRAALACVAAWRFRPGTFNGEPVTVAATVEVNFRLER